MLDKHRIETRIEEIRSRVKILEKDFKKLPEDKLITDQNMYAASERHLEVAIQCVIDIGNHYDPLAYEIRKTGKVIV